MALRLRDMKTKSKALRVAVCIWCLAAGCSREPHRVALPNGYELLQVDGYWSVNAPNDDVELTRSHSSVVAMEFVVPQHIVLVGCQGGLVFGVVKYERLAPFSSETLEGYFLLDANTHDVQLAIRDPAPVFEKKGISFANIEMTAPAMFRAP